MKLEVRAVESEADEATARAYARANLFSRALLHASLEHPVLRGHSRHWLATLSEQPVGLAALIDGVFRYTSAPLDASLPGVAAALIDALERPARVLATEMLWPELVRAGAERARVYLQMARLRRGSLPEPDPTVKRIDDLGELARFYGTELAGRLEKLGFFVGVPDESGELAAAGGVEFASDVLAQIARIHTRPGSRRQGLARVVVAELLRELESAERCVILQVRADNTAAQELYAAIGFRGTRRFANFELG